MLLYAEKLPETSELSMQVKISQTYN